MPAPGIANQPVEMPILFKCELCRARLSISRKKAGKMGTCPKCGGPIQIPSLEEAESDRSQKKRSPHQQPELSLSVSDSAHGGSTVPPAIPTVEVNEPTQLESVLPEATQPSALMKPTIENDTSIVDAEEVVYDITSNQANPPLPFPAPSEGASSQELDDLADHSADEKAESMSGVLQSILVPRWIVYFQAGLIGVVAATFFVFGMMVGNLTTGNRIVQTETVKYSVNGRVELASGLPDSGAVILALPIEIKPDQRLDPNLLHPDRFEPVNNPSIDQIRSLGGDVARVNRTGEFELQIEGPAEYYLLVISKSKSRGDNRPLEKQVSAKLGRFFLPYEPLIDGKEVNWSTVRVTSDKNLRTITL